jgi:hypothetical protein
MKSIIKTEAQKVNQFWLHKINPITGFVERKGEEDWRNSAKK